MTTDYLLTMLWIRALRRHVRGERLSLWWWPRDYVAHARA